MVLIEYFSHTETLVDSVRKAARNVSTGRLRYDFRRLTADGEKHRNQNQEDMAKFLLRQAHLVFVIIGERERDATQLRLPFAEGGN